MTTETPETTDPSHRVTLRRLLGYARHHKGRYIGAIVALLITSAIEPLIPALFKKLLDSGFQAADSFPIWMVPAVVIVLFAVRGVTTFSGTYLMTDASSRVVYDVRRSMMATMGGVVAGATYGNRGVAVEQAGYVFANAAKHRNRPPGRGISDGLSLVFPSNLINYWTRRTRATPSRP